MWLMCLRLFACALLIANNTAYADCSWKHISLTDAIQFAVDDIQDKFTNAVKTITPHPNTADSPLNQFVNALTIEAQIKPILLQDANIKLDVLDDPSCANTFVTAFIKRFTYPFLVDAIQQRLLLLHELNKIRVNEELKLVTARLETFAKSVVFEGIDPEALLQNIVSNIKEFSTSDEIKKTLSYPVVKEEFIRVLSKDFLDKDALINTALEILIPFIREGIQNADTIAVNLHSTEAARNGIKNVLIPQYISLMKDAILKANTLDAVLKESYEKDDKISKDMEEEYAVIIRQAISIDFVTNSYTNYPDIFTSSMIRNIRAKVLKSVKSNLQKKLNIAMGIAEPYIVFDDNNAIVKLRNSIVNTCIHRINTECDAYTKLHQTFSKENRTRLAEFAIQSLKTEYKDIQTSQIEILKRNIPNISDLATYYYNSTEDFSTSDRLKSFQNYLENETINVYGFSPGMFIYSKPYFDVLEDAFSQSFNSLGVGNSNIRSKLEL